MMVDLTESIASYWRYSRVFASASSCGFQSWSTLLGRCFRQFILLRALSTNREPACITGNMQQQVKRPRSPAHPALRDIDPATRFLYTPKTVSALLLGGFRMCLHRLRSTRPYQVVQRSESRASAA